MFALFTALDDRRFRADFHGEAIYGLPFVADVAGYQRRVFLVVVLVMSCHSVSFAPRKLDACNLCNTTHRIGSRRAVP